MAATSTVLPTKSQEIVQLPVMQRADMEEIEDKLFTKGVGQEVLAAWQAKEAACAPAQRERASVLLDAGTRRLALKNLVSLCDRFVVTVSSQALSSGRKSRDDIDMERMDAASLAVAIFHRLDDRVLLGAAATNQPDTLELRQLQLQQELQRSVWALAWLGVKHCAGSALMELIAQGTSPEAPPGAAERELEIMRALRWSPWCPNLFSWTAFFRTRLLALQGRSSGERVMSVWMASLSTVWVIMANSGESSQLRPHSLAAGIFYPAYRQVCMGQGNANPLTKEEVASLVWVTGVDADTMEESARMVSTDLMISLAMARHHTTI